MSTENTGTTTTYHIVDDEYDEKYLSEALIHCRCIGGRKNGKCIYCEPCDILEYFENKLWDECEIFDADGIFVELLKQIGFHIEIDAIRAHENNRPTIEQLPTDEVNAEIQKSRPKKSFDQKTKKQKTKNPIKKRCGPKEISQEKKEKHDRIIFFIRMFQVICLKALSDCCDLSYKQTSELTVELEKLGFIKKFEKVKMQLMRLTKKGVERSNSLIYCSEHAYGAHPSKISSRKLPEILDHGYLYRTVINDKVPKEYRNSVVLIGTSYTERRLAEKIQPDLIISYFDEKKLKEVFIAVELEGSEKKTSELELKMWHLEKSDFDEVVFYATTKHLQKKISSLVREGVRGWVQNSVESYQDSRRTPCLKTDPIVRMFASVADR